jgi:L-ascorbate metabolism protein UlaG (beta-lactamase superfamily)
MREEILQSLRWLGHDGFAVTGAGHTVVFDPYQVAAPLSADVVLVTHPHYDHCSPEDIAKVSQEKTVIVTEAESAAKLSGSGSIGAGAANHRKKLLAKKIAYKKRPHDFS